MFCPQCGREQAGAARYCCNCGAPVGEAPKRRLRRSADDKKIAGVCGGFAEYLDIDPTLVRLGWVMLALLGGWGIIGYILAWIILPIEKPGEKSACSEAREAAPQRGSTAAGPGSSPAVS